MKLPDEGQLAGVRLSPGQPGQKGIRGESLSLVRSMYELATQPLSSCCITYTVEEDGAIRTALDYEAVEGLPEIPDFAMIFTLPADYDQLRFYGYGPLDNYVDRSREPARHLQKRQQSSEVGRAL